MSTQWRLKSQSSRLFTQPFIQAQIKEDIKALRHWPLWGESTSNQWIPLTKGQQRGKCLLGWRYHVETLHATRWTIRNDDQFI